MNDNEFNAIKLEIEKDLLFRHSKEDIYKMLLKAIDIINSQNAEIERLNRCVKTEDEVRAIASATIQAGIETIKAEAIKEFAGRLIDKKSYPHPNELNTRIVCVSDIQEMVGDKQ